MIPSLVMYLRTSVLRSARLLPLPLAVLALAVGALAPAPASAQWQKNEQQIQRQAAEPFHPLPLVARRSTARPPGEPPKVLRLRFYADGDYRATGSQWQERVRGLVGELNQLLVPAFGVRFEVDGFRRWDRRPGVGALPGLLGELQALDAADDVDWVVGLVSALPLVSQSFHDLGLAPVPGRHLVLRGTSSIAEMEQLRHAFPSLDARERERLYSLRKSHKERAAFLHEWAHSLGLGHAQAATHVMSPSYSNRTSLLDEKECERIATALARRPPPTRSAGSIADPTLPRLPRPGAPPTLR